MQRTLKLGCQPGPDVMDLQDALNILSATSAEWARKPRLVIDGVFGHETQSFVMELQKLRGLPVDGIVTTVVWEQIRLALNRIPGLAIVRPLGGGGAGPCKNVDPKAQGSSSNLYEGKKMTDPAAMGGAVALGGAQLAASALTRAKTSVAVSTPTGKVAPSSYDPSAGSKQAGASSASSFGSLGLSTLTMGSTPSTSKVIAWTSGLQGIDRQNWMYAKVAVLDGGSAKEQSNEKEPDSKKG